MNGLESLRSGVISENIFLAYLIRVCGTEKWRAMIAELSDAERKAYLGRLRELAEGKASLVCMWKGGEFTVEQINRLRREFGLDEMVYDKERWWWVDERPSSDENKSRQ